MGIERGERRSAGVEHQSICPIQKVGFAAKHYELNLSSRSIQLPVQFVGRIFLGTPATKLKRFMRSSTTFCVILICLGERMASPRVPISCVSTCVLPFRQMPTFRTTTPNSIEVVGLRLASISGLSISGSAIWTRMGWYGVFWLITLFFAVRLHGSHSLLASWRPDTV